MKMKKVVKWICNPENSERAAPFLIVADALFTLLTVKVFLCCCCFLFLLRYDSARKLG